MVTIKEFIDFLKEYKEFREHIYLYAPISQVKGITEQYICLYGKLCHNKLITYSGILYSKFLWKIDKWLMEVGI